MIVSLQRADENLHFMAIRCWRSRWVLTVKVVVKRVLSAYWCQKPDQIVGRYFTEAGVGFVVPDDSRLSFDILIPPDQIMGARIGLCGRSRTDSASDSPYQSGG